MKKFTFVLSTALLLMNLSACAKKDTVYITWNGNKVAVQGHDIDSLKVTTKGTRVVVNNGIQSRMLTFVLSGKTDAGSFTYKGKHKATFELDGLTMNSTDSIPLRFKNGKKNILVLKSDNSLTVSADTLDGALISTKGKLQIDGNGSLVLKSASVGCKGLKVGEDLVMNSGNVSIETSGNFVEIDNSPHPMAPITGMPEGGGPGGFPGGGEFKMPEGGFPGMPGGGFPGMPEGVNMDSLFRKMGERMGFPGGGPGGFPGGGEFKMPEGGFPGGGPDGGGGFMGKRKYNGSTKGIRVANTITINGGTLSVKTKTAGAEGIEGKKGIIFNGGTVIVEAQDDAINSSGKIVFNGGKITAMSRGNDCVDSNYPQEGAITISGGEIYAYSLVGPPEEGMDCDFCKIVVEGGKVFTVGGSMAGNPSSPDAKTAHQPTVVINGIDIAEGKVVTIKNNKGKAIYTFTPKYSLNCSHSLITCPDFKNGQTYKVFVDGKEVHEFTFKESFTTVGESGGGFPFGGGGFPFGGGGFPGGGFPGGGSPNGGTPNGQ